ncbi:hypothetical protein Dip510_000471 [Elusimicrobium posterum]|uniref:hypothetical protein n=1 Tax=Elusimicrobium posterum TaxID=3116653 RepID=UPI003C71EED7
MKKVLLACAVLIAFCAVYISAQKTNGDFKITADPFTAQIIKKGDMVDVLVFLPGMGVFNVFENVKVSEIKKENGKTYVYVAINPSDITSQSPAIFTQPEDSFKITKRNKADKAKSAQLSSWANMFRTGD